jgi:alpha-tubulin suppressor-like RCC1 family protein
LGQGNQTYRSSPVQVGALTNWLSLTAGYDHTMAIKTDGTLWAWGRNQAGQLGLGVSSSTDSFSSPIQVGALTNWQSVSAGWYHNLALKTDSTLWTWGVNTQGQLGLGDTTVRSSPIQVGASTTWLRASAGHASSFAIG